MDKWTQFASHCGLCLWQNRFQVQFLVQCQIYLIHCSPTHDKTWVSSWFSGYIWLVTKIVVENINGGIDIGVGVLRNVLLEWTNEWIDIWKWDGSGMNKRRNGCMEVGGLPVNTVRFITWMDQWKIRYMEVGGLIVNTVRCIAWMDQWRNRLWKWEVSQ